VRALRRFRYDPEFRGAKRVPIRVLAALLGLSHTTLYESMRPDRPMRPGLRMRLGLSMRPGRGRLFSTGAGRPSKVPPLLCPSNLRISGHASAPLVGKGEVEE
jgi:hypothetical protein